MNKTYKGTNTEPIKVWGVLFKKGTITKVETIDEDYTIVDCRSGWNDEVFPIELKIREQQIIVHTKDDCFYLCAPQWGFHYTDSLEHQRQQDENFRQAVNDIIAKLANN